MTNVRAIFAAVSYTHLDVYKRQALSVAKLMKTDKALMAASKISERMQFMNLATKIGELREKLLNEAEEVDEEEDD